MGGVGLDVERIVEGLPAPILVLAPDGPRFTIRAASDAYLRATMTERSAIVGRGLYEVFPGNPDDPDNRAVEAGRASLQRVVDERCTDVMGIRRHDLRRPASQGGGFEERWWRRVNSPILGDDGQVICIVHQVDDVTEHVKADDALRSSENQLRAAIDSMLDPHMLLSAVRDDAGKIVDFVFTEANPAACEFTGLAYDELLGTSLLGAHPGAGTAELFGLCAAVVETGEPLVLDDWAYPPDMLGGEERRYDVRAVRVGDAVSQTWRDVTERHAATAALAASEEHYRLIAENTADVVARADGDGVIQWVSPSLTALTGWRPEELVGRAFVDFLHPDDLPGMLAAQPEIRGGAPAVVEARLRLADGGYRWASSAVKPVLDEAGAVVGRVGAWRDIQAEMEARQAMAGSEQRYRSIFDASHDGIVLQERDGRVIAWNEAASRIFGGEPEAFAGGDGHGLDWGAVREDGTPLPISEHPSRHTRATGESCNNVVLGFRRGDELRWIDVTTTPLSAGGGELPTAVIMVVADVTEQHRVRDDLQLRSAQLEASNRELEAFAYSVSHDLRQPLSAINAFSQLVVKDAGERLSDDEREYLARVCAATKRMAAMIDGLLELSRVSRIDLVSEPVDVSAVAHEVIAELRAAQPERRVECLVARDLRAQADPALVRDVLVNLLGNAFKFTSEHETARIEVGATDVDGERVFYVRDDGAGFDKAYAGKLFEPFHRLHRADEFPGTGIGLATARRLVTRLGGRVWAEAEVEKGATFFFTLPGAVASG